MAKAPNSSFFFSKKLKKHIHFTQKHPKRMLFGCSVAYSQFYAFFVQLLDKIRFSDHNKAKNERLFFVKYIIFDMDDTLLNNERKISDYTLHILKKLQAMGHKIVINTARSKQYNQVYFDRLKPDYAILNGGALIIDRTEAPIYKAELDVTSTQAFIRQLLTVSDNFTVQSEDGPYSHLGKYSGQNSIAFDFSREPFPYPCLKVVAAIEKEEDAAALAQRFGLTYVSYFGGLFKRFNHPNATKAQGNRNLMELTGGSLADVIAFGDDLGDLEMLQQAGVGVLMCNAKPELHSSCAHLSKFTNDEDGVARFLTEYFCLSE